jgi:hypothetical protein
MHPKVHLTPVPLVAHFWLVADVRCDDGTVAALSQGEPGKAGSRGALEVMCCGSGEVMG